MHLHNNEIPYYRFKLYFLNILLSKYIHISNKTNFSCREIFLNNSFLKITINLQTKFKKSPGKYINYSILNTTQKNLKKSYSVNRYV